MDSDAQIKLCLTIITIAFVIWVAWLCLRNPREGYADQVLHGSLGIAGPVPDYDYYPYDEEMYDDSSYRV